MPGSGGFGPVTPGSYRPKHPLPTYLPTPHVQAPNGGGVRDSALRRWGTRGAHGPLTSGAAVLAHHVPVRPGGGGGMALRRSPRGRGGGPRTTGMALWPQRPFPLCPGADHTLHHRHFPRLCTVEGSGGLRLRGG